jgi:hypothetical protein
MKNYFKLFLITLFILTIFGFLSVPKAEAAIAFRSAAGSSINGAGPIIINKPAGVVDGDVMVAMIYFGAAISSAPSDANQFNG